MNIDMDQLLEKWADARNAAAALEKKMDNYKKIAKQYMLVNNIKKYENDFFKLSQSTHSRASVQKKDVPKEIWDQYAKSKDVEYITLTEKKAKQKQSQQQQALR
jgi:hypothetical protein